MARKPFDPTLAQGALFSQPSAASSEQDHASADPGARAPGVVPMTVTALASRIKEALRLGVPGSFSVRGELGRVSRSQHLYATLREADATIGLVMFARELARLDFEPREGLAVVVRGRLDFYGPQGKLQVIAETMEPDGQGDLDARKRELERVFRERGWFDAARKRSWPRVPRHVAIVTSEGAAALHDVLNVHRGRGRTCTLTLVPTLVQGDRAATEVAAAIERANAASPLLPFDCILLVRGGGSKEDLWAFNEAAIVEAIVRSRLPVITGIGHEIDVSLADLAADGTAATPSLAAASVFADRAALDEELSVRSADLDRAIRDAMDAFALKLERLTNRPVMQSPAAAIVPARARVDGLAARAQLAVRQATSTIVQKLTGLEARLSRLHPSAKQTAARVRVDDLSHRLAQAAARSAERRASGVDLIARHLEALSPTSVLERGYSITLGADGQPIRSADRAAPGTELVTVVADGRISSTVTATEKESS
ncbi:MAG: exodeoxyribonuclease VII large subunit [Phycisphaerae bacterium]|nr:exodeoxyribonuclease VII large subunit [Phycisphaerae bacterium]